MILLVIHNAVLVILAACHAVEVVIIVRVVIQRTVIILMGQPVTFAQEEIKHGSIPIAFLHTLLRDRYIILCEEMPKLIDGILQPTML